jgi:hypothetical protein
MMWLRRTAKIALLIFGLLPFIYFALFFTIIGAGERTTSLFFIVLFILMYISVPGALVFYIIHVYRSKRVKKDRRHLWAALLFFGSVYVFPFYWYLHVWREPKRVAEGESGLGAIPDSP